MTSFPVAVPHDIEKEEIMSESCVFCGQQADGYYEEQPCCSACAAICEIDKLAKWFQSNLPEEIQEGSAVDNAIRLLEKQIKAVTS